MYRIAKFNDPQSNSPKVVKQSATLAFKFALKAANANHVDSMFLLSGFFKRGYGTEVNRERAKYWHLLYLDGGKKAENEGQERRLKIVGAKGEERMNAQCITM